jgi:hypothetical protein
MSSLAYIASDLARRGLEFTGRDEAQPSPEQPPSVSLWGLMIFSFTCLVYAIVLFCIQYTYGNLVSTLAAVEDPNPDVYVRIDNPPEYDTAIDNDDANDAEASLPKPQPITSSLRRTVAHLQARGGRWARFRGFRLYFIMGVMAKFLASIFTGILGGNVYAHTIAMFVTHLLLANLETAWVHIVISEPSSRPFYRRIPGWKTWIKVAPAAALRYFAVQLSFVIPVVVGFATNIFHAGNAINPVEISPDQSPTRLVIGIFLLLGLGLILYLILEVPAKVAFIRVAASMLPEEDEAIVPFDRSFGSKVTPEIIGGSGKIGLVEAWRSFDWGSRVRFIKVVIKAAVMVIGVSVVMGAVIASEAFFLFPSGLDKISTPSTM